LLRKLRNDAAHSTEDFTFQSSETRQRVFALKAPRRIQKTLSGFELTPAELDAATMPDDDEKTAKMYLILSGMSLSIALLARRSLILQHELNRLQKNP
jgi:hypothetical protein